MTTAIDAVVSRLERVTHEHEGQWNAKCPAHDDRKNSLAISTKSDGTILMFCQAKCSTAEVLERLGLSMRDSSERGPAQRTVGPSYTTRPDWFRTLPGTARRA